MSLDNLFMHKVESDQKLLDDQCDLLESKELYKNGDIDLIEYMERTTHSREYKRLKENYCGS